jgi:replicative DNA helicase
MAVARSHTDLTDKLPPQSLEAERALLGCMLLSNESIDDVADLVRPKHFYLDKHRRIAEAICRLYEGSFGGVDAVTLGEELEKRGELEEIGGHVYLHELMEAVPHAVHSRHYASIVRDKAMLRDLREACRQILRDVHDEVESTDAILSAAERRVFNILEYKGSAQNLEIREILMQVYDSLHERWMNEGALPGLGTGFTDLDRLLAGLHATDLIILAARPSLGKTAFACNIALAVARHAKAAQDGTDHSDSHTPKKGVLIFSLEQSKLELAERFLCIVGSLDGHRLKRNELDEDDRRKVQQVASDLSELPIFIDDQGSRSMSEVSAIARRMKRRYGISLIVIDYLQLIEPEDRASNREQQVAQIARRLKHLAKDINVPVVALAQLNRGVELRENKRPRLADLRESGAIEQDADLVLFLHRDDAYDETDNPGEADVIVAKHRNGPIGAVKLTWLKECLRFANYTREEEPAGGYFNDRF